MGLMEFALYIPHSAPPAPPMRKSRALPVSSTNAARFHGMPQEKYTPSVRFCRSSISVLYPPTPTNSSSTASIVCTAYSGVASAYISSVAAANASMDQTSP